MKLPVKVDNQAVVGIGVALAGVTAEQFSEEYVVVRGEVRFGEGHNRKGVELVVTVYNSERDVIGTQREQVHSFATCTEEPFETTLQCSKSHGAPASLTIIVRPT